MKLIATIFLLLISHSAFALTDDACKLYLCLMGVSEADGGSDCVTRFEEYLAKFNGSCPDLPTCVMTSWPTASGVLMSIVSASGGGTQGHESGSIVQVFAEEGTPYRMCCEISLNAPAANKTAVNEAYYGGL